ncbi:MAG: hypothetical protein HFJ10_09115 [Lachnospiraceae bacterium]|nr:hypothetical protein [Lachnospiraceae bacterium]
MSKLYTASNYKNTIINLFLTNKEFMALLGSEEQGQIFDYPFADETTSQEKTFVVVEADIESIRQELFIDFNLYVYVFTSKNLVRITEDTIPSQIDVERMGYNVGQYGNRVDLLCDMADRILNGTTDLKGIGNVKPAEKDFVTLYAPNHNYYGKRLKYQISNYSEWKEPYGSE